MVSLSGEQLAALTAGNGSENAATDDTPAPIDREEILKKELEPATRQDMKDIIESIKRIRQDVELCNRVGQGTMSLLEEASINIGHDNASIVLSFDGTGKGNMAFKQFSKEEHRQVLQEMVGEI